MAATVVRALLMGSEPRSNVFCKELLAASQVAFVRPTRLCCALIQIVSLFHWASSKKPVVKCETGLKPEPSATPSHHVLTFQPYSVAACTRHLVLAYLFGGTHNTYVLNEHEALAV